MSDSIMGSNVNLLQGIILPVHLHPASLRLIVRCVFITMQFTQYLHEQSHTFTQYVIRILNEKLLFNDHIAPLRLIHFTAFYLAKCDHKPQIKELFGHLNKQ